MHPPSFTSEALTYSQAKTNLNSIYKSQPESFYCGCDIKWLSKKKLVPETKASGYKARNEFTKKGKVNQRALRIEWEHIVPAWEFGHQLQCWQKGKRKYCAKNSNAFKNMEGDLHNLVPAIGEVIADRSNFKYGLIDKEVRVYGQCDAEVNFKGQIFEPAPNVRGNIARTYSYFEKQYVLKISKKQKQLYTAWDKAGPVDKDECNIHLEKSKIQGNNNPFVSVRCH
jgi:deoxyribonuclease-1